MAKNWKYFVLLVVALFIDIDVPKFYYEGHQVIIYGVLFSLVYYQYWLYQPDYSEYKKAKKYSVVNDLSTGADVSFFIKQRYVDELKFASDQLGISLEETTTSAMLLGIVFMHRHAHGSEFYEYVEGAFLPVNINRELSVVVSQPTDDSTSITSVADAEIFTLDDYRNTAN